MFWFLFIDPVSRVLWGFEKREKKYYLLDTEKEEIRRRVEGRTAREAVMHASLLGFLVCVFFDPLCWFSILLYLLLLVASECFCLLLAWCLEMLVCLPMMRVLWGLYEICCLEMLAPSVGLLPCMLEYCCACYWICYAGSVVLNAWLWVACPNDEHSSERVCCLTFELPSVLGYEVWTF